MRPEPIERTDEPPAGILLGAIGCALAVLLLGLVRRSDTVPVIDVVFYGVMFVLACGWFCFSAAYAALKKHRFHVVRPGPVGALFIFGGALILYGFFGGDS